MLLSSLESVTQDGAYLLIINNSSLAVAQQSVHLTLGILRQSQAVFYALAFFWLDGFAVPAPAQVTQTVGCFLRE